MKVVLDFFSFVLSSFDCFCLYWLGVKISGLGKGLFFLFQRLECVSWVSDG
jgi:hypothetical protein